MSPTQQTPGNSSQDQTSQAPACPSSAPGPLLTSLPHTFRWETQGGEWHKPLQFSCRHFPARSVLSSLHHTSHFANSCYKAWGQSYAGAIKSTAGTAPLWAAYLSFPGFSHLAGDGCRPSFPSSPRPSKGSSGARARTGRPCPQQLPRPPHGSRVRGEDVPSAEAGCGMRCPW